MEKRFLSLITETGAERLAKAAIDGGKVGFTTMAIGDGNGSVPVPDKNQKALVNEVFRSQLNSLKVQNAEKNIISAEMIIPPEAGGFTIREAALFDDDGECLAVASVPETYKPLLAEGSGRFTVLRIWIAVNSADSVELIVDSGMVLATVEDVIYVSNEVRDYTDEQLSQHAQSRDHPDATLEKKGFVRLSSATDSDSVELAATPAAVRNAMTAAVKTAVEKAVRAAWEDENPVGTVKFYARNVDPNQRWPWSQWVYTGENLTIRVAKADGSNVGTTGGSDTVTLQRANLPAVQVSVSGETSELPAQELTTQGTGRHKHKGGMLAPGEVWDDNYVVGSDNDSRRTRNYTDEAGDHSHIVGVPAHKHTTTGKTENLGEGKSFSVVEAHTLLMCWSRVA